MMKGFLKPESRLPRDEKEIARFILRHPAFNGGWLLFLAQKQIPMGTAYAVWTGIGAAGTFILGVAVFGDALNWGRALGVAMIIGGVVVLKAMTP